MYGILISLGILLSSLIAEKIVKKERLSVDFLWGLILVLLVTGVLGARLYHVVDYWHYYSNHLFQILMIWNGGLGIFGAIIFGLLGAYIYADYKKESLIKWLDITSIVVPLGQAIGRWGNYFNNELLPYAIYESIADFFLFLVLMGLYKYKFVKVGSGRMFALYIIGYSIIRIALEPYRKLSWYLYGVSFSWLISILFIILGLLFLYFKKES